MAQAEGALKITLVKSTIGHLQRQKDTARALGLRKMHQTVIRPDNPQMRGMVFSIQHLVQVETVDASEISPSKRDTPKGAPRSTATKADASAAGSKARPTSSAKAKPSAKAKADATDSAQASADSTAADTTDTEGRAE
jgi:large subunit ribosomal protein L30